MNESFLKSGLKRILCLIIALLAVSGIPVYSENQSWLTNSLRISLDSRLTLLFTNEFRNQEFTFMNHYLANVQSGFQYSLSDNSYIAFLYKRENSIKPDSILNENRYTLETGWNKKLGSTVNFDLRFKTEGRTYEKGKAQNHFRFRLRLRCVAQLKVRNYTIKPFIASEPFGDTLSNRVTQNRLSVGASFPLGQHSTFTLNYIRQDTKNKNTFHILNAGFHLKF